MKECNMYPINFGEWVLLKQEKVISYKYYECKCSCGKIQMVRGDSLTGGRSSRCRSCRDNAIYINSEDYIGKYFGDRFVLREGEQTKNQQRRVWVRCKCGLESLISLSLLKNGKAKACRTCNLVIHGMEATPTYYTWRTMKARCLEPKHHNYKHYGARGIKICDRWLEFKNFFEDMGVKPKGYQIDRIDNNGNYEPGNCKWVTPKENSNNRRKRPVVWNIKKPKHDQLKITDFEQAG